MTPEQVLDLDVLSFNGYLRHVQRVKALAEVQFVWSTFVGSQAQAKDVKKWTQQLMDGVDIGERGKRETNDAMKLLAKFGGGF
jgi:hypothetical protein